jgi:hypothetical protein
MAHDKNAGTGTGWRIDKTIPLPLLFAIGVQTIVVVIWGVHVEDRQGEIERTATTNMKYIADTYATRESYVRVDDNIITMKNDISSIKDDVRRLTIVSGGAR